MNGAHTENAFRHVRIMASAGSGKTFRLANRYLRLLHAGADPSTILASTFTRAAAGEIRDRILSVLADAAEDESKRRELAKHIGSPVSADNALDMLARLTGQLHRLQIRTLDGLFARIVRCFPFELDVDPAATLVDEPTGLALRQEAIRLMLDERDPQPMIDLLRVLVEGAGSRPVTETIDVSVKDLHETYREAPRGAWESIQPHRPLTEEDFARAVEAFARLTEFVEATQDEKGTYFNHGSIRNAFAGELELVQSSERLDHNRWHTFLSKGAAKKILEGDTRYYRRAIPDEVAEAYAPLIDHARALLRNVVVARTRSTRDLLDRFDARHREVKSIRKAMTFADLTHSLLAGEAHDEPAVPDLAEVYFRLDASLHHVLLDEMQDTSTPQWRVLQPIVKEIVSYGTHERTFFCVGDVKQSIYGWREACPEILESLDELLIDPATGESAIRSEPLDKSYRSSQPIIDVVNRVFCATASNAALEKYPDAAAQWDGAFALHTTHHESRPGYVELRIVKPAEDDEDQHTLRLREAADVIAKLHNAAPNATIGVLMRQNRDVYRLLYELEREGRHVPAAAVGGGALTDAAPVNAILDLLRVTDHPRHTIAAFNVMHSPLGPAVGLTDAFDSGRHLAACRAVSQRVRRSLLADGYAATVHGWIEQIVEHVDPREFQRLVQLERLAAQYDADATLRADDFVRFIEQTSVEDAAQAPVQVMTIHQSKGLQFDVVVLPELEGELASIKRLKLIADRDHPVGSIARIARHVGRDVWEMFDDLRGMLERHENRQAREGLSLLYVAMTRARYALHMIINPLKPKKSKKPDEDPNDSTRSYAGVLRHALIEEEPEAGGVAFAHGTAQWHTQVTLDEREGEKPPEPIAMSLRAPTGSVPRGRLGRSASAHAHDAPDLREALSPQNREARERGTALHAMFETIAWLEDYEPDRAALGRIAHRIAPRRGREWAEQIADEFLASLTRPDVVTALSRAGRDPAMLHLRREFPYARLVDGAVQQGFIDRLVLEIEGGGPIRATVLDFKSDQISEHDLAQRAETYRVQMEQYRDVAAAVFNLEPGQITLELLFVTLGRSERLACSTHSWGTR